MSVSSPENIFRQFGVTQDLLGRNGVDLAAGHEQGRAKRARILQSLKRIAPRPCGVELVRIGPADDGGYLVPDDLDGIEACFSPGCDNFKDFEDQLVRDHGIKTFICDNSSDIGSFRTPLIEGMQSFEKKWLDVAPAEDAIVLDDWVRENTAPDTDLILQMDIEGAEYRNLMNASPETLRRFRIIVIEIHCLHLLPDFAFLDAVFDPAMAKLEQDFTCVHIHPNNFRTEEMIVSNLLISRVMELTFLRKDRVREAQLPLVLPHPLDRVNVPDYPPVALAPVFLAHADRDASHVQRLRHEIAWHHARLHELEAQLAALD
ncbi:FkbM family methyltransferase [Flavimaricola marinus]|uniref:Methyltransferase FkbM domain-containing protein n=1 Tax=Flavimaricola marinus TaxID=1819565 RepID=A0A238LAH5_9RHOB|nr:FkbM family methyltransferase [Flavimaricola marinus]SMY06601.1 hypothetical protein LOM8899_00728 [Flavimaricola marinus]